MVQPISLDTIDEKILNELLSNSKLPLRELAKRVGTSFVTAMNRAKKMEKNGIIQKYTCKVNYEKLGYDVAVLIEMRIAKGRLIELERKIAKSPHVLSVYDTTGDYDAVVLARFKTTRAMDTFIKEIQTYDFVERTNTKLILNTIKEEALRI